MKVREATISDVDDATATLTRALADYPMCRACFDPDGYLDRLAEYHRLFVSAIGLPHGRVWVTDDVSAVAVWLPPDLPALAAVEPDRQRQGLGRAVIEPGLATADAARSPAFVETQDPANVTFYESLGFTVIAELELPHNGPMHYALYRAAR